MGRTPVRGTLLIAFIAILSAGSAAAKNEWIRITSANFELYTTAGEKRGRKTIQHLEGIRQFFLDVPGAKEFSDQPVRIIGFRSKKEYKPYSPNEVAVAFYTSSRARDYIVMSGLSSTEYPAAVHEYMHLIQRHSGKKYSLWMREGLAQLYETLTPVGKQVRVGDVNTGRYRLLRNKSWMDLETLFSVGHDSEHYNKKKHAGMFYGQSWALTHMLTLEPKYQKLNSLGNLINAVVGGESEAVAFQRLYGKTLDEVYRDLRNYIREGRLFAALFDIKLQKGAEDPQVEPAGELEAGLVLADLLSVTRNKQEEARAKYAALGEKHPRSPEVYEGLGYLAWRARHEDQARQHLGRAVELGSKSVQTHRDYVYFLRQAGAKPSEMIEVLEKALLLQPDDRDSHYRVAFLYLRGDNYIQALRHMGLVRRVQEEKAFRLFDAMAYAYSRIGRTEDALKAVEKARRYAKDPNDILLLENRVKALQYQARAGQSREAVAAPEPAFVAEDRVDGTPKLKRAAHPKVTEVDPPPQWKEEFNPNWLRAEGTLEVFECLGQTANMHIQTADKRLVLAIIDPDNVIVRGAKASLDFQCGAQGSEPIVVEYEPSQEAGSRVAGVVRAIEYQ